MARTDRWVMSLNEELWFLPYPKEGDVIELVCVRVDHKADGDEAVVKYRVKPPPLASARG